MKVAVFGATGRTGSQIVSQALELGHDVTAFARRPEKLPSNRIRMTVVQGTVLDPEKVREAVAGCNAVLMAVRARNAFNPGLILSEGTQNIVDGMKSYGVRRIIAASSMGVGANQKNLPIGIRVLMTVLRKYVVEQAKLESVLMNSGLDWVIVRMGRRIDGPRTGQIRFSVSEALPFKPLGCADAAGFMLSQLTSDEFLCQPVVVVGA